MPPMPLPPMPTKWIVLMRRMRDRFIARASAAATQASASRSSASAIAPARAPHSPSRASLVDDLPQAAPRALRASVARRQLALGDQAAARTAHANCGVARLVVVDRRAERHEDRADAGRGELGEA